MPVAISIAAAIDDHGIVEQRAIAFRNARHGIKKVSPCQHALPGEPADLFLIAQSWVDRLLVRERVVRGARARTAQI